MGIFSKGRSLQGSVQEPQPPPPSVAIDRLLPALRTQTSIEQQKLHLRLKDLPPAVIPTVPFAGAIEIALVQNLADSPYVDNALVETLDTSFEELLTSAIANLDTLDNRPTAATTTDGAQPDAESVTFQRVTVDDGLVITGFGSDDFLGARILSPDYLSQLELPDLTVAINPARNVLIFADATSPSAMSHAFDEAESFAEGPGLVSVRPIIGNGRNWQELELPSGHPSKPALHRLHNVDRVLQTNALNTQVQQLVGQAVFVEPLVGRTEAGRPDTVMCWREGQQTLMAEADTVVFLRQNRDAPVFCAPWDAMIETVGMLLTATSMQPRRWRRSAFPSEEQLERMGAQPLHG